MNQQLENYTDPSPGPVPDQVPRPIQLPFVVEASEPGIILDHSTDGANAQHRWAEILSPWTCDHAQRYQVGEVTYIVADDAADPPLFMARVAVSTFERTELRGTHPTRTSTDTEGSWGGSVSNVDDSSGHP